MKTVKHLKLFFCFILFALILTSCMDGNKKMNNDYKENITDGISGSPKKTGNAVMATDFDCSPVLNPVNGNYIIAEISGEGVQCGEFTMFECTVKKKIIDENSEWLEKLYVPNSALSSINGYTTLLAAVKVVSYEDGLISDDVRSYSINMRNDGSLCCIPFDESGTAVVDDMHYLDLRYGDSSEFMVNGLNTTPYQYAFAEKSEKDIYIGKVSEDESIFDSIRREHEKKYYDLLLEILPDYLIESGTAEKDAEKYFDALETARQLEDELYSGISEEALEHGILVCF